MLVNIDSLSYSYGDKTILKNINFSVEKGEVLALVGKNGSGKTTMLNCIQGVRTDYQGSCKLFGRESKERNRESLRRIGVQFQSSSFFNNIKVGELLVFIASLYDINLSTKNAESLLSMVHMEEYLNNYVSELSGGQKQRVSLAICLINKPEVIFLDEPTLGLDIQTKKELWKLIKKQKEQGQTIVLTTHYINEIKDICDRLIIINGGEIILNKSLNDITEGFPYKKKISLNANRYKIEELVKSMEGIEYTKLDDEEIIIYTKSSAHILDKLADHLERSVNDLEGLVIADIELDDIFLLKTGGRLND
ncbi:MULTISPECIES: ABC transporter ATP-binding protein [unclassified Gemella]|uniref:ABC transporter ATP-binding protein n=1 Tax=unclassified Gemella TaxID=2624949 RepID=UPI0015D08211|nr:MULTISPECIES: ABC transporter ATP-binding protein [unclassified Gemella]MBF0710684.1 ABC transporter ATP-binding protein [Gemella sp. GL1.1]NYS28028.1 ABC transporter ATP-binding protein [Gemella sp. GL1]